MKIIKPIHYRYRIMNSNITYDKENENFNSNLSPKISVRYSPFDNDDLYDLDRQININNIFSDNRLGLADALPLAHCKGGPALP